MATLTILPPSLSELVELVAACPSGCEERQELAEAIDAYKSEHGLD